MKASPLPRKTANLSESFQQRLKLALVRQIGIHEFQECVSCGESNEPATLLKLLHVDVVQSSSLRQRTFDSMSAQLGEIPIARTAVA
jgi:hypothetical protein